MAGIGRHRRAPIVDDTRAASSFGPPIRHHNAAPPKQSRKRPPRSLLGERDRARQRRSGPIRTTALSPKGSRGQEASRDPCPSKGIVPRPPQLLLLLGEHPGHLDRQIVSSMAGIPS